MDSGGTEAFPDLGEHCQHSDCHQLDFLPFKCGGCHKFFCVEHRSYKSHECPKSDVNDRKVVVCEICSSSIEITGSNSLDVKSILQKHEKSGDCDPKKKKKPKCPVRRCKEQLTFSNTASCQHCHVKVCLKHRFPADHACERRPGLSTFAALPAAKSGNKFLEALASRNGKECGNKSRGSSSPPSTPSVKAY
ncbi:OLC1v1011228C1 [Oldenlandia corymbosa var. corymbosa]|uniref:OLC1v1011228C1 n=1 Tax=Oldenlandia corymbosa var. corymbosa TaxID=529605 RepID=A0AAV1DT44_OLDCO|nr:OLC1v1011228C1 [Oldenlandia corymbosa var. corymbosa]